MSKINYTHRSYKENADIFSEALHRLFNTSGNEGNFISAFKLADVTPIFEKGSKNSKDNYRPISILKNCQKYLKKLCINRWLPSWINTFINVALLKAIAHSNVSLH